MITTEEFLNDLKKNTTISISDKKITKKDMELSDFQLRMLKNLFIAWSDSHRSESLETLIADVLKNPCSENGKVYEALVYAWMEVHFIDYSPQIYIEQDTCFKAKGGYYADGVIRENDIVFDVKSFGLTLPHIEILRRKIQEELPEDFYLTISGGRNISTRDLQNNFLDKTKDIAQYIMDEKNKLCTDYVYKNSKFNIEFRASHKKSSNIYTSISEFNPYEWAKNNEFYFLFHASQFCMNSPYILFCAYDDKLALFFSREESYYTFCTLRTLCRRIFMNLIKMDDRQILEFDGKARTGVSVATAVKKISAIVFLDVTESFEASNSRIFVFQNPNADHKIPRYQINQLFRNAGAVIDDFEFDNY